MACVIFSSIFKESAEGISFSGNVPNEEAYFFQEVGSEIVLDSLALWNIE
jgi:hypothetical protein